MNLKGIHKLKGSREQVWIALNDSQVLRRCTPGCKQLVAVTEDCFDVVLEIGIAAIKGRYMGQIKITKLPDLRYTLVVSGNGAAGFMNATGAIQLGGQGNETVIEYVGEVNVGGLVAGVGQRVMEGVARLLVGQFFKCLETALQESGESVKPLGNPAVQN